MYNTAPYRRVGVRAEKIREESFPRWTDLPTFCRLNWRYLRRPTQKNSPPGKWASYLYAAGGRFGFCD